MKKASEKIKSKLHFLRWDSVCARLGLRSVVSVSALVEGAIVDVGLGRPAPPVEKAGRSTAVAVGERTLGVVAEAMLLAVSQRGRASLIARVMMCLVGACEGYRLVGCTEARR